MYGPQRLGPSEGQLAELLKRKQFGPELTLADHVHDLDASYGRSG
jgi:hypothetical protein